MTSTKLGGYSSYTKTYPRKHKTESPLTDSKLYPINFITQIPLFVSMGLLMFSKSYQEQGTEAYYIYFSRTHTDFQRIISDALIKVDERSYFRALKKLSGIGWISIPNPKEGDRRLVWRYDKRAPASLYAAFGIEPRPCMILPEGPSVEGVKSFEMSLNGCHTQTDFPDDFPDVLRDEVPTIIKAVDTPPVKTKPLSMQERLNLKFGVSRHV